MLSSAYEGSGTKCPKSGAGYRPRTVFDFLGGGGADLPRRALDERCFGRIYHRRAISVAGNPALPGAESARKVR